VQSSPLGGARHNRSRLRRPLRRARPARSSASPPKRCRCLPPCATGDAMRLGMLLRYHGDHLGWTKVAGAERLGYDFGVSREAYCTDAVSRRPGSWRARTRIMAGVGIMQMQARTPACNCDDGTALQGRCRTIASCWAVGRQSGRRGRRGLPRLPSQSDCADPRVHRNPRRS